MKQLLTITLGGLLAINAAKAATLPDGDTLVIENPHKVTIITGDSVQKIKVTGQGDDKNYLYENTIQLVDSNYVSDLSINRDRWDFSFPILHKRKKSPCKPGDRESELYTRLGFGWVSALGTPEEMEVSMGSSWEIFWTILQWEYRCCGSPGRWSVGLGLDWRNYRMTGPQRFVKGTDGDIRLEAYPEGAVPQFSRVKVFSLQMPVLYRHSLGKQFSVGIGPVFNLNTHSSLKTRYKIDGKKYKDTHNNAHAVPLTVDFMGIIGTPVANVYVKYSPCNVLKTAHAPKFQSLSLGIYL